VVFGAPSAGGDGGALEGVVAKLVAVVALGSGAKAKATLKAKGGGEGGEAWKGSKVLCLRAGDGDDNCRRFFTGALVVWFEPSGRLCKCQPSVESGEFLADVGKRVGGGNTVHKELCRGGVQLDGCGARDEVKELRDF
jgi:hypothetical protein